jgi:chaperonin cofactor prefoldin
MAKEGEAGRDVSDLRERVVRLEVKVEELSKRIDSLSNYAKELYNYLQKQSRPSW